jgi:hypothetical protein
VGSFRDNYNLELLDDKLGLFRRVEVERSLDVSTANFLGVEDVTVFHGSRSSMKN